MWLYLKIRSLHSNQVEVRSVWWAQPNMANVLVKGGNLDIERHTQRRKMVWIQTGRRWPCGWRDAATSQGTSKIASKPPEGGRGKEWFPYRFQKGHDGLQNWEIINFCFKPPSFGYFVTVALGNSSYPHYLLYLNYLETTQISINSNMDFFLKVVCSHIGIDVFMCWSGNKNEENNATTADTGRW